MKRKLRTRIGRLAVAGALLGSATAFQVTGGACNATDFEALAALAILASQASQTADNTGLADPNQSFGDGSVRQISDGTSNTVLFGEGGNWTKR